MAGSDEEQALRALSALVTGHLLSTVMTPEEVVEQNPGMVRAGYSPLPGRVRLAAALRTIWPPPPDAAAQLQARSWVPAVPAPGGSEARSGGAPATAPARGLAAQTCR